jgi:hypothetical protein
MIMNKYILFILTVVIGSLLGCTKPNPNPHLGDFIYSEFQTELGIAETKLAERQKERDDFLTKMKNPQVTDLERKSLHFKADYAMKHIRKLEQQIKYWKLKLLSREESVRHSYLNSFNEGKVYDNSDEISRYQKAISRLRKSRRPSSQKKEEPAKPAASESAPPSEEE